MASENKYELRSLGAIVWVAPYHVEWRVIIISSINENEMLKYAVEQGIIDITYVRGKLEMQKRDELLAKHPYKIYQGNDDKWHTYLPDNVKGRIPKKRKTKEEIEDIIVKFWAEKIENPTVNELFNEWIEGKVMREEISKSTRDRYIRQHKQCFEGFGKLHIKNIEEYDIEEFLLNAIHDHELTAKSFSNLRTLIFGIFKLAKKKRLISYSITEVVNDIEISRKSFRKVMKTDEEQIFMEDELPKVIEYLENNLDIINLGILLMFKSGIRIGELAGLKKCDVDINSSKPVIHIERTEICYEDENGVRIYEVRDFPKTEAGIRDVYIPKNCEWILRKIRNASPFGEFFLESNGERIKTYIYRSRLNTICKKTGVVRKSPHKIRKTYGTILLNNGIDEAFVIGQMGHTDINTTKNHYYRNRKSDTQKSEAINNVIGL